jgi:hypothetical protein
MAAPPSARTNHAPIEHRTGTKNPRGSPGLRDAANVIPSESDRYGTDYGPTDYRIQPDAKTRPDRANVPALSAELLDD